jgi:hypothetical protein
MKFIRLAAVALFSCAVIIGSGSRVQADESNQKTLFTFSGPVEIPAFHGPTVLPKGTYVFKLLDALSDRNIVQIFNSDETHLYATILAIPDYRLTPSDKTVLTFEERAEGSPQAIKAWFYPGDDYGQEFVYPKSRAVELAKLTHQPVLSMPDEAASSITTPIKSSAEPAAIVLEKAHLKAEKPTGGEEEVAQVVGNKPSTVARNLPRTASEMPLVALCGALLIGLGTALLAVSRRFA